MSYEPTTWKAGDKVTSAKLNKMEQGIANCTSPLVVEATVINDGQDIILDKTWQEIYDAFPAVFLYSTLSSNDLSLGSIIEVYIESEVYHVKINMNIVLTCYSPDDYPQLNPPAPDSSDEDAPK